MTSLPTTSLEVVRPRLTEVEPDGVRIPEDDEVLITHGIDLETMRSGKIGELAIYNSRASITFGLRRGFWHTDPQHVQLHLTVEGRCRGRLAGIVTDGDASAVPYRVDKQLARRLDQNDLKVDLDENDLLVFNGGRCFLPMSHRFDSLTSRRLSYQFMHWPGKS